MAYKELDPAVLALVRRRTALRWTQLQVAMRLGYCTAALIGEWETGRHSPSIANLRRWADALECDLPDPVVRSARLRKELMRA